MLPWTNIHSASLHKNISLLNAGTDPSESSTHSYLELYQVHIHVSIDAVLLHRVCEVSDSLRRGPQPGLDLRQVQNHLPVGPCVERRGFLVPAVGILFLGWLVSADAGPTRIIVFIGARFQGGSHRGYHRGGSLTGHRWYGNIHGETQLILRTGLFGLAVQRGDNKN